MARPIPGNTITLIIIPVCLLQMTSTCVTPSFLRKLFWKIWDLLNKTETDTNITIHKMTERIESNKVLEIKDDKRSIH